MTVRQAACCHEGRRRTEREDTVAADRPSALQVTTAAADGVMLLTATGTLDSDTYRPMRDQIIEAALAEPGAVVIDISDLEVPTQSALAVFTSARWHVLNWPGVPIVLVCRSSTGRSAVATSGVSRYVAVHPSLATAVDAMSTFASRSRRRARAALTVTPSTAHRSRLLVEQWLAAWSKTDLVAVSKVIVTALVENVLRHTDNAPTVRLESKDDTVTVAVEDASTEPPTQHESLPASEVPTGLRIVSALSRTWGNAPTPAGKTVWAVIGPENRL